MYFINQQYENDCGFTSLKILLANLYKKEELLFIKNPFNKNNLNLFELIEIASRYDVILKGYRMNNINNEVRIESKILVLTKKDNLYHMIYIYKTTKKYIYALDPKIGKLKYEKDEFLIIWTGVYLKIEDYKRKKKFNFKSPLKLRYYILTGIFQILSTCSILMGFYLVDEKFHFSAPLICFTLFIICLILNNLNSKKAMKNIDYNINCSSLSEKRNFSDYFINITKYKSLVLISPLKFITNLLVIIFSIAILCINEYYNLIFLSSLILITLIDYFVFNNSKFKYNKEISFLENKITKNKLSGNEFGEIYKKLSEKTNKFSSLVLLRKYLIYFIIFCLIFTMMAITKNVGLNYMIFYFVIYTLIYQNLNESFSFNSFKQELRNCKLQFVSLLYD